MKSCPAVFLDLNGTIVSPVQVTSPDEYEIIPGTMAAVRLLNEAGFLCPVVTIQSRIEKGAYSEQTFLRWFASFQRKLDGEGAKVLGPYLCPHRFGSDCECVKPKPALYLRAAGDFGIDCRRSYVVGDTVDDIRAARAIGAKGCFVLTGWGPKNVAEFGDEAAFVGKDILAVAQWIVEDAKRTVK